MGPSLSNAGRQSIEDLVRHFQSRVLKEHDIRELASLPPARRRRTLELLLHKMLSEERVILPQSRQVQLVETVLNETVGFGPLEPLLEDETISEIMVVARDEIYVERAGKIERSAAQFNDSSHIQHVVERIIAPIGRRLDDSSPMVDARLPDGSRVNAVIPPISINGPVVTIRKFRKTPLQLWDLCRLQALTPAMATFLTSAVRAKLNFVVSGGTGSGKTTLLAACASEIPVQERLLIIEDMSELRFDRSHTISLEARPANVEGRGEVSIRSLVRNALRMRPDRIIVGEVRGAEAFDMLQAMNSGHEGSLTTIHANTPADALSRLESMVVMAGNQMPLELIRQHIVGALDLIVQIERLSDGSRKIVTIAEIQGDEVVDLFRYDRQDTTASGDVIGQHVGCGRLPHCWARLKAHGVQPSPEIFDQEVL